MIIHPSLAFSQIPVFWTNNSPQTAESINFGKLSHLCYTFTPPILIEHVQKRTEDDYLQKQDISLLMSKDKNYCFCNTYSEDLIKKNLVSRNTLKFLCQVSIESAIHLHDRNIYLTKNCRVQSVCTLALRKAPVHEYLKNITRPVHKKYKNLEQQWSAPY